MASKVTKNNTRKRKLETEFIEVSDNDCSPPSSPENKRQEKNNESIENENIEKVHCEDEKRAVLSCTESNKVIILSSECNNDSEIKSEVMDVLAGNSNVNNGANNLSNDKFLFSLKFRDKIFADLHRKRIISAIMGCLDLELREEEDELGLKVKFWENKSASDMEITSESDDNEVGIDTLFVVDKTPSSSKALPNQPKFYSRTKYIISDENQPEPPKEPSKKCNQSTCFNCDGPHPLRDCKEPKNFKKINAARNRHKELKSAKNTRYHLENEQKYGHLSPGRLSSYLREALGIEEDEIPPHIYHMRRLGYPMGWLEASKKQESDLELYDFNGKNQKSSKTNEDMCQYDLGKVVEYAGFNAPLPEGAKDLHSRYNCPPYNEKHSVKYMLDYLKKQSGTTPKNLDLEKNSEKVEICQDSSRGSSKSSTRPNSPTLTDLELEKQKLLDILNNGISLETPECEKRKITLEQLDIETPPSIVKSSSFGTPLIKNFSPFEKLPKAEKFSIGVSQVINFENLPDSTGKYEQMTNVLDKVRKTIKFSTSGQESKDEKKGT